LRIIYQCSNGNHGLSDHKKKNGTFASLWLFLLSISLENISTSNSLTNNVPRTVLFAQFTPFFDQFKVLCLNTKEFYDNLFQIPSQAMAI
jgi:hypothetical protein